MNTKISPKAPSLSRYVSSLPLIDKISKAILCSELNKLKHGMLIIQDQDETLTFGNDQGLSVHLKVKRPNFYSRSVFGGSIGNAESYVDGDWECANLTDFVRLFVKNRELLNKIDSGLINLLSPLQKIFHGLRANTIKGSRENIRSHYDMGNDFFKLFLDKEMMYSSAIFESNSDSLEEASLRKMRTICEKLELKPTDHLLEIGTGWGAMAIYAAQNYHCKVTTTTISEEQFAYAKQRIKALGLENLITIVLQDYRKLEGTFDKLVSIEMIEAVGLNNLDTYFSTCSKLLKPNGLMVLQAITIRDHYYENAKKSVDFIQRHIFPGSGIPSVHAMMNSIVKSDMIMIHQQDYAEDYAKTINHWSLRFENKTDEVLKLGYSSSLPRLWQYYFAYCEGGFKERAIGMSQIIFAKPEYKKGV